MSGYVGDLSAEQEKALVEFRTLLDKQDLLKEEHDDYCLLRFLRARKFVLADSELMFKNWLQWRKDFGADTIRQDFDFPEKDKVRQIYPFGHHKTDKYGRPIYIERLGKLTIKDLFAITDLDRMLKWHVHEWEVLIQDKFPACSNAAGKKIETSFTVLDLSGIGLKHVTKDVIGMIKQISKLDQDNYPEMLGKMYVINAPMLFSGIWKMIKGFLDPRTTAKIEILGSKYKDKLLEHVPAENLPEFLGGTCDCEGGCMNSDAGPWHDPKYMVSGSSSSSGSSPTPPRDEKDEA